MIHVVAAALTAPDGRVLIAQRPPGKRQAGCWEFPGGKLEPGETRAAGLARELREELGIAIREPRPLRKLRHSYDFGEVLIDLWVVTRYAGDLQGIEGQSLRWCTPDELSGVGLLPADLPLLPSLGLPERLQAVSTPVYAVGEPDAARARGALAGAWCASLVEAGTTACAAADFLVMRRAVADAELTALCGAVAVPVYARLGAAWADTPGAGATRAGALERAWELGATGLNEL